MNIKKHPLAKQYVAAWKKLKTIPDEQEIFGFQWYSQKAKTIKLEIMNALMRRINSRGNLLACRGRKDNPDQMTDWLRDKRILIDIKNNIRHYQFNSHECKVRFSNRLSNYNE